MDCLIQLLFLLFFLGVIALSIISKSDQGKEFWKRFHEKYWNYEVLSLPLVFGILIFFTESDPTARSYAFFMIAIILACEGIVLYAVHLYKKRKRNDPSKEQDIPRYLLCFVAALLFAYSLLFEDMYSTFDCRSDTQKCEYYSSTLINWKLNPAKTYDISKIIRINVINTNRKRRIYNNHPYNITFFSLDNTFSMPQEFSSYNDAANEAAKINDFLGKKQESYHYEASRSKVELIFDIIITPILFIYGLILYGREKERKRGEKKQEPVSKPLLRRRLHSSQKPPVKKDDTDV